MKPLIRWLPTVTVWCAVFCLQTGPVRAENSALDQPADAAWNQKSYARAAELYAQIEASGTAREPEVVTFRLATALFKIEKWDEATAAAQALLNRPSWTARANYLLACITYAEPHEGYRVGAVILRGKDYPPAGTTEPPVRVDLSQEDREGQLRYLEAAKVALDLDRRRNILAVPALRDSGGASKGAFGPGLGRLPGCVGALLDLPMGFGCHSWHCGHSKAGGQRQLGRLGRGGAQAAVGGDGA